MQGPCEWSVADRVEVWSESAAAWIPATIAEVRAERHGSRGFSLVATFELPGVGPCRKELWNSSKRLRRAPKEVSAGSSCTECSHVLAPRVRFCSHCGAPQLTSQAVSPAREEAAAVAPDAAQDGDPLLVYLRQECQRVSEHFITTGLSPPADLDAKAAAHAASTAISLFLAALSSAATASAAGSRSPNSPSSCPSNCPPTGQYPFSNVLPWFVNGLLEAGGPPALSKLALACIGQASAVGLAGLLPENVLALAETSTAGCVSIFALVADRAWRTRVSEAHRRLLRRMAERGLPLASADEAFGLLFEEQGAGTAALQLLEHGGEDAVAEVFQGLPICASSEEGAAEAEKELDAVANLFVDFDRILQRECPGHHEEGCLQKAEDVQGLLFTVLARTGLFDSECDLRLYLVLKKVIDKGVELGCGNVASSILRGAPPHVLSSLFANLRRGTIGGQELACGIFDDFVDALAELYFLPVISSGGSPVRHGRFALAARLAGAEALCEASASALVERRGRGSPASLRDVAHLLRDYLSELRKGRGLTEASLEPLELCVPGALLGQLCRSTQELGNLSPTLATSILSEEQRSIYLDILDVVMLLTPRHFGALHDWAAKPEHMELLEWWARERLCSDIGRRMALSNDLGTSSCQLDDDADITSGKQLWCWNASPEDGLMDVLTGPEGCGDREHTQRLASYFSLLVEADVVSAGPGRLSPWARFARRLDTESGWKWKSPESLGAFGDLLPEGSQLRQALAKDVHACLSNRRFVSLELVGQLVGVRGFFDMSFLMLLEDASAMECLADSLKASFPKLLEALAKLLSIAGVADKDSSEAERPTEEHEDLGKALRELLAPKDRAADAAAGAAPALAGVVVGALVEAVLSRPVPDFLRGSSTDGSASSGSSGGAGLPGARRVEFAFPHFVECGSRLLDACEGLPEPEACRLLRETIGSSRPGDWLDRSASALRRATRVRSFTKSGDFE